jgi:hypothetical protein
MMSIGSPKKSYKIEILGKELSCHRETTPARFVTGANFFGLIELGSDQIAE